VQIDHFQPFDSLGPSLPLFSLSSSSSHSQVQWSEDPSNLLDPQMLHTLMHSYSLNVSLHEVGWFKVPRAADVLSLMNKVSLELRWDVRAYRVCGCGHWCVR
jgi:hypothetical protein